MSVSEAFRDVAAESMELTESAPDTNGFLLEPRCRICRNDQVRTKVNDLLATGASYAMVLRALGDDNAKLEKGDRVTIDSIRNHTVRHFPVQQVARATYREVLERRAKENSVDFIEGVATAITPLAVLETVMVKGYQTLVDEHTSVSYRDAMEAALKLNEIARKDEGAMDRARMLADMGRIIEVVRTFIPAERWPDVQAALRGETPVSAQPRAARRLQIRLRRPDITRSAARHRLGHLRHRLVDPADPPALPLGPRPRGRGRRDRRHRVGGCAMALSAPDQPDGR